MTPIHVIGIGLDGASGLPESVRKLVDRAALLVGSSRHLSYFPHHAADQLILGNLNHAIEEIRRYVQAAQSPDLTAHPIVILTSGDPLFFGLGRLLLNTLPPEWLTFHPHVSAVQLAFNRLKLPWQDAHLISAHGRSLDELTQVLQQGAETIAILTDPQHTPAAVARLLVSLNLATLYQLSVCEALGGSEERIQTFTLSDSSDLEVLQQDSFSPLNVVVLVRTTEMTHPPPDLKTLPLLGIPDQAFLSFRDRPGLMTKREVRVLGLSELALQNSQVVWDVGAGTGSVSIEIARFSPTIRVYAIEKTAAGMSLIQQNCQRFQVSNVTPICGSAPDILNSLPDPHRIFIGGSGGNLLPILEVCHQRLVSDGIMVLALATLEHLTQVLAWLKTPPGGVTWHSRVLQVNLSRSLPIGNLTRLAPLNPVTLITATRHLKEGYRMPQPPESNRSDE